MAKVTVYIGRKDPNEASDTRQKVEFEAEVLGEHIEHNVKRDLCGHAGSAGRMETLYRTADGRFMVHVHEWGDRPGDPSVESLHEVTEADLLPGGRFALLGAECGFGRSPT